MTQATHLLSRFDDRLSLPLIAAPMFLVSGIELVVAACRNGVIGSFPTVNCRSPEQLDEWLGQIERRLQVYSDASGMRAAPICANLGRVAKYASASASLTRATPPSIRTWRRSDFQ